MPFTLSHPAAVALLSPLIRRARLPFAALVIGTMSPDFEFFLHLRPLARWSHSLAGLVTFCLPAGLLTVAMWELVAREPLRHLLGFPPHPHQGPEGLGWWVRAGVGVVLGAATHLLWDGFTHGGYWGVALIPGLRAPALSLGDRVIPWFNLLQHASTAVGGLGVLAWATREARRAGALDVLARSAWRWLVIVAMIGSAVGVGLLNGARTGGMTGYWAVQAWVGRVAVAALAGFGVALIAYSIIHRVVRRPANVPMV